MGYGHVECLCYLGGSSIVPLGSPTAKFEVQAPNVESQTLRQAGLWQQPLYSVHSSTIAEQQQRG